MQHSKPRQYRRLLTPLDVGVVLALAVIGGWVVFRAATGLEYKWDWSVIPQYLLRRDEVSGTLLPGLLLQGLITTLRLSLWGGALALVLGLIVGLARTSRRLFLRQLASTYVGLIRNAPPLVIVFVFYFFLSDQIMAALHMESRLLALSGNTKAVLETLFGPVDRMEQFLSAMMTIALFEGAYMAEIIRAGIESIEQGQWEASRALGFTRFQQMRIVIVPQALQRMLPALAGQLVSTVKDSSIVAVISIQELTFQGLQLMATTYRTFEVWITVLGLYFLLTLTCSLLIRRLELTLSRKRL